MRELSKTSPRPACSHSPTWDALEQADQIVTKGVNKPLERARRRLVLCLLPGVSCESGSWWWSYFHLAESKSKSPILIC